MSDAKPNEAAKRLARIAVDHQPADTMEDYIESLALAFDRELGLREIEEALQRVKLAADMDTGTWNLVESALARLRGEKAMGK